MATAPILPLTGEHSARWKILGAVHTALQAATELAAIAPTIHRNPVGGVKVERDKLAVVLRWDRDRKLGAVAMDERRTFSLMVGCIANTDDADADADVLSEAVGAVLRRLMPDLNKLDGVREVTLAEADINPLIEDVPIDGALVVSTLDVSYRQRARYFVSAST